MDNSIDFEKLLPMGVKKFEEHFRNKQWFVAKGNPERFNHFSWEYLDEYLNSSDLNGHDRLPRCQIINDEGKKYCHRKSKKKMNKEQMYKDWKKGNTFVLTACEFLNKTMWNQCMKFEEYYGRGCANIYCSSKQDAYCFHTHADRTENFLFHVKGTVRWYIMNEYKWECPPEDATVNKIKDLEEGDLLYLPINLYHKVETLEPRISISYHFTDPKSWKKGKRNPWYNWIGEINE
jgi:ribosomal protein L16 Arg81 hydroxylase